MNRNNDECVHAMDSIMINKIERLVELIAKSEEKEENSEMDFSYQFQ